MAQEELPPALAAVSEAVLAYQDTQEGLNRVRTTAMSAWGDKWREQLKLMVKDVPSELAPKLKANIDRALSYEKAGSMWVEASRLIDPRRPMDLKKVEADLGEFQKWLSVFGKAGADMFAKLQQRVDSERKALAARGEGGNPYGLTMNQLWNFDHFVRLKTYYDQTISRTSARCVHLGGLELTQYPYYGYILDLLDEILTFGMEILTPPYKKIVADRFKGGEMELRKVLSQFQREFETNAPPEMLSEEESSMDEIKGRLGILADANEEETDIGPAPDGFDPDNDVPVEVEEHVESLHPTNK